MTSADVQTLQNSARDSLAVAKQQTLHVKGKLLEREKKRGQRGVQQKGRKRISGRPQRGLTNYQKKKLCQLQQSVKQNALRVRNMRAPVSLEYPVK